MRDEHYIIHRYGPAGFNCKVPEDWVKVGTWMDSIHSAMGPFVYAHPDHVESVTKMVNEHNKAKTEHSNSYYSRPWV